MPTTPTTPTARPGATDPFAVFRPRRGRAVAAVMGTVILALHVAGAILMPGPDQGSNWTLPDRLMLVAFGLGIACFLWRYAMIRAVPTAEHLAIRNLIFSRRIEWSEIVSVQFAGGDPWVRLDLADTEQLAIMAIQKADGAFGRQQAARLVALVEALSSGQEPNAPAAEQG